MAAHAVEELAAGEVLEHERHVPRVRRIPKQWQRNGCAWCATSVSIRVDLVDVAPLQMLSFAIALSAYHPSTRLRAARTSRAAAGGDRGLESAARAPCAG